MVGLDDEHQRFCIMFFGGSEARSLGFTVEEGVSSFGIGEEDLRDILMAFPSVSRGIHPFGFSILSSLLRNLIFLVGIIVTGFNSSYSR